jgi:ATPase subunit of ABC transporter with duplicated ATPase domains
MINKGRVLKAIVHLQPQKAQKAQKNYSGTYAREVSQRSEARQEEVRTAAHRYKLWQTVAAFSQSTFTRYRKSVRLWAACNRHPITHHRITLFTHAIKLRTRNPRALHKLKLPRDVRIDTNEM